MNQQYLELPGSELLVKGLSDIEASIESIESLLLLVCAPRLASLGIKIPGYDEKTGVPYEHQLYQRLEDADERGAHRQYNALIRRMSSFCRALGHQH